MQSLHPAESGSFMTRPISAGLMIVAAILLILAVLPVISKRREVVFTE